MFTENADVRFIVKRICVGLGTALLCLCVLTGCGAAGQSVCLNCSLGEDILGVYAKEVDEGIQLKREEDIQIPEQEEKDGGEKADREGDEIEKDTSASAASGETDTKAEKEAGEQEVSETSVTYCMEMEEEGIRIADRITLTAQGDRVVHIDEILTVDLSFYDEEIWGYFTEAFQEIVEEYQAVNGTACQSSFEGGIYTLNISIDAESEAVAELAEKGMLIVDGNADKISLEESMKGLEDGGYERERIQKSIEAGK